MVLKKTKNYTIWFFIQMPSWHKWKTIEISLSAKMWILISVWIFIVHGGVHMILQFCRTSANFGGLLIWLLIKKVRNCITIIDSPMVHLFWPLNATIILPKYLYGAITNMPPFHNKGPSCSSFESVIPFDGVYLLTLFVGVCEKWTLGLGRSSMCLPNLIWFELIW